MIIVDKKQRTAEAMAIGQGYLIKVFYWRLLKDKTISEAAEVMDKMFMYTWRYVVREYNS